MKIIIDIICPFNLGYKLTGEVGLDLPPLDPFLIPEMLVEYRQGDVRGKMLVKNSKSYGLTNLLVRDVR